MPIQSKHDLKEYIIADLNAQPRNKCFLKNEIVNFKLHLRKCEYHHNSRRNLWHLFWYFYHLLLMKIVLRRNCSEIPINVFGKGLVIWHLQRIIVNGNAKVGDYCSISSGVVIAQAHDKCPIIGNYVELMIDSKVLGDISIADHVRIGADALVLKTIAESDTTWGGGSC